MTKPMTDKAAAVRNFAMLFEWHILNGTRPENGTQPGALWRDSQLAQALHCDPVSIRNWRRGRSRPVRRFTEGLADIFFGGNPSLKQWRAVFLESWRLDCMERRIQGFQSAFAGQPTPVTTSVPFERKDQEAMRDHVIARLSELCHLLDLPLTGVEDAADRLLRPSHTGKRKDHQKRLAA